MGRLDKDLKRLGIESEGLREGAQKDARVLGWVEDTTGR